MADSVLTIQERMAMLNSKGVITHATPTQPRSRRLIRQDSSTRDPVDESKNLGSVRATCAFNDALDGELSFEVGQEMTVMGCENGGWLPVSIGTRRGLVPANHVEAVESPSKPTLPRRPPPPPKREASLRKLPPPPPRREASLRKLPPPPPKREVTQRCGSSANEAPPPSARAAAAAKSAAKLDRSPPPPPREAAAASRRRASAPLLAALGEKLLGQGGCTVSTAAALEGKRSVALYFSASWCPPCRRFTPVLAGHYSESDGRVEVVFVSRDRDEASFLSYFATMPWLALPFSRRDLRDLLATENGVTGIPTLVVLDVSTGAVTARDAIKNIGTLFTFETTNRPQIAEPAPVPAPAPPPRSIVHQKAPPPPPRPPAAATSQKAPPPPPRPPAAATSQKAPPPPPTKVTLPPGFPDWSAVVRGCDFQRIDAFGFDGPPSAVSLRLPSLVEYLRGGPYDAEVDRQEIVAAHPCVRVVVRDALAARAAFAWAAKNVVYDFASLTGPRKAQDAQSVIQRGNAVCEGYANLFHAIATGLGLKSVKIFGMSKGGSYRTGDVFSHPNDDHAWSGVACGGRWMLVDACWGGGSAGKVTEGYSHEFHPLRFCAPPDVFALDHWPMSCDSSPPEGFRDWSLTACGKPSVADFSASHDAKGTVALRLDYSKASPPSCRVVLPSGSDGILDVSVPLNPLLPFDPDAGFEWTASGGRVMPIVSSGAATHRDTQPNTVEGSVGRAECRASVLSWRVLFNEVGEFEVVLFAGRARAGEEPTIGEQAVSLRVIVETVPEGASAGRRFPQYFNGGATYLISPPTCPLTVGQRVDLLFGGVQRGEELVLVHLKDKRVVELEAELRCLEDGRLGAQINTVPQDATESGIMLGRKRSVGGGGWTFDFILTLSCVSANRALDVSTQRCQCAVAMYAYVASAADELSFAEDDRVEILDNDTDPNWWRVRTTCGSEGLVPANYFRTPNE